MVLRNRLIPENLPLTRTLKLETLVNVLILVLGVNTEWARWPMSCRSDAIAWGKFTIWFAKNMPLVQSLLISDTLKLYSLARLLPTMEVHSLLRTSFASTRKTLESSGNTQTIDPMGGHKP